MYNIVLYDDTARVCASVVGAELFADWIGWVKQDIPRRVGGSPPLRIEGNIACPDCTVRDIHAPGGKGMLCIGPYEVSYDEWKIGDALEALVALRVEHCADYVSIQAINWMYCCYVCPMV